MRSYVVWPINHSDRQPFGWAIIHVVEAGPIVLPLVLPLPPLLLYVRNNNSHGEVQ